MRKFVRRVRHDSKRMLHGLRKFVIKPTRHFIHIPKNGGTSIRDALGSKVSFTETVLLIATINRSKLTN